MYTSKYALIFTFHPHKDGGAAVGGQTCNSALVIQELSH